VTGEFIVKRFILSFIQDKYLIFTAGCYDSCAGSIVLILLFIVKVKKLLTKSFVSVLLCFSFYLLHPKNVIAVILE